MLSRPKNENSPYQQYCKKYGKAKDFSDVKIVFKN